MIPLSGSALDAVVFLKEHWQKPSVPNVDIVEPCVGVRIVTPTGYSLGGVEICFIQRFLVDRDPTTDKLAISSLPDEHYAIGDKMIDHA
jgi:hypothetical protein